MGSETRVPIDGKCYTPQELSALILQKLKADAGRISVSLSPGGHHRARLL